ncbi:hypothetical protein AUEXF2481DRAFT_48449 [Aureobasidium subglaciale EXF-2481]|uniref:Uncharacterized protein n=1 Tax=Aureobasidium subglaciale (strain EXF-2481) TaxID=1043005 RepID=A0A074Y5C3_AURSE|nr:uncharacterized protein AUEXF2481DRAFT_48449 [Aureobasidium subglaciale EXF-2481]KEQ91109.1 hypothetical protein AUEXF2481DRAFT_48449 [Aureobasidium subglaciale EXF-2481]
MYTSVNIGRPSSRYRLGLAATILFLISILLYTLSFPSTHHLPEHVPSTTDSHASSESTTSGSRLSDAIAEFRNQRVACKGPRGKLMSESYDDQIHPTHYRNLTYPPPLSGSYEALDLDTSWLTAAERYGPYGLGEEEESYTRSRVDWSNVNWADLQNACVESNRERLPSAYTFNHGRPRFTYRDRSWKEKWLPSSLTTPTIDSRPATDLYHRSAIVIRVWSTYKYTPEDMWNLRSLVAETTLATGGEYAVFLLVDVKDKEAGIHKSAEVYDRVLCEAVPPELQDIAVLFDDSLLESWYPDVVEHLPIMQIMQPLQIFAQFYPEFDHYWQLEVDSRFLGHTGNMLDKFADFARKEPRKQARERASWAYMADYHGSYDDFFSTIDNVLDGDSSVWASVDIHDIDPIGPLPPVEDPREDHFTWGVGEEADLILLNTLEDASRDEDWLFKGWHHGFSMADKLPVFVSVVAQGRASWNLLNAIHHAQAHTGMRIPSEATLPSFALWHGLKISGIPLPVYQWPGRDRREMEFALNGGDLTTFPDAIANGPARYRGSSMGFFTNGMSWQWWTTLPEDLANPWYINEVDNPILPDMLLKEGGNLYAPNIMIHPRKTNGKKPKHPGQEVPDEDVE